MFGYNIVNFLAKTAEEVKKGTNSSIGDIAQTSFKTFKGIVNTIFPIFIGIILVIALFYGVQLGIKYAKAEEEEEKKKAKTALINIIVGCLIAIVFVAIVEIILVQDFVGTLFGEVAPDPAPKA